MLVKVRYADNSTGTVDSSIIDQLVRANEIRDIHRSTGWVDLRDGDARKERADRRRNPGTRRGHGGLIDIYV